jgi:hypothetical protein
MSPKPFRDCVAYLAGHYLTSARGGKGALLLGAVASAVLGDWGKAAEMGADEFAGEVAIDIFFPIRFLADATTDRKSAWTGLGTNRGAESTPDFSDRTEMVCGWYPLSSNVAESSVTWTVSSHGVRQVCPKILTSAPAGTDSSRNAAVGGDARRGPEGPGPAYS